MGVVALTVEKALPDDQAGIEAVKDDGMEKIRALLFGEQMQRFDGRVAALAQEMEGRFRQLKGELTAMEERLQQVLREEAESRISEDDALAEELRKHRAYTDQRLDDLDTELSIHLQSLQSTLDKEVERLQQEKAGREVLARMLEGMAIALRGGDGV